MFLLKKDQVIILISCFFILSFVVLASFIFMSGQSSLQDKKYEAKNNNVAPQEYSSWIFGLTKPVFAQVDKNTSRIKPAVPAYQISIDKLENLQSFIDEENIVLSEEQKKALEERGFFLIENDIIHEQSSWESKDDFVDTYDVFDGSSNQYYRTPNNAIFITSDLALHLYHILVDRSFQKIEESRFQPMLRDMTGVLFEDAINKYNTATDLKLKDSYKRLTAYYLVPLLVLDAGSDSAGIDLKPEDFGTFAEYLEAQDHQIIAASEKDLSFSLSDKKYGSFELSDEVYELAKSELDLIRKAKGTDKSPIFSALRPEFINDYSQFKPRSHYTKNDVLKSYFIAMMWYGRMGFVLSSPELTRDALIITAQINNLNVGDEKLSKLWSDMSAVIDFFVGEIDDLTAYEYSGLMKDISGGSVISEEKLTDDAFMEEFISRAKSELPAPKIVSEVLAVYDDGGERDKLLADIKQFRFMGQRFTPDAYIINNLTQGVGAPDPETGQMLPTMPTALMPLHVIEPQNEIVKNYLDEWINDPARIEKQGRESDKIIAKKINKLTEEFRAHPSKIWTQNIYWSWLDCFRSLLSVYGTGYPMFMQNDGWMKKNLGTVLGSFSELKHDTLLYAKQSYAELGGGGENPDKLPPVVKGYVEPDLEFWNKIIALAKTTQKGLDERGVFPQDFRYKYEVFIESAEFFRNIVQKELQNQKISDDDFEKLRTINSLLTRITDPVSGQELTIKEKRAGIVADIHTDGVLQDVLYEATGKPFIIYVAVKDVNGMRLTRGLVFNHYEFTDKLDERLSDEDWQARVYDGKKELPSLDKWSQELLK